MSQWFNYAATFKILLFSLLVGAALPGLFAVAMRVNAAGAGASAGGTAGIGRKPVLVAVSWVIFALVLVVVVTGVLFIARDFIGHHTGWYLLGAQPTAQPT